MHLTPIRGRNQRGIAFVNSETTIIPSRVYSVKYEDRTVYCDLRQSHLVPREMLVLDSRLFDELNCVEGAPVVLDEINVVLPKCQECSLSIEDSHGEAPERAVKSVTTKPDDLREHLDSLILRPGQRMRVPELGVNLVVLEASPLSDVGGLCRISWASIKKIELLPVVQPGSFNLVCLLEFGFRNVGVSGNGRTSGTASGIQMVAELIRLLGNTGRRSLYAVVIYSTDASTLVTYDPVTGEETSFGESSSGADVGALTSWLEQQTPRHTGKPIRPAVGLERAMNLAREASASNGMATAIVMFTRGTYSAGGNPVAVAARSSSEGKCSVFCIPLPESRNLELIHAIAQAGGGKTFELGGSEELHMVIDAIQNWSGGVSK